MKRELCLDGCCTAGVRAKSCVAQDGVVTRCLRSGRHVKESAISRVGIAAIAWQMRTVYSREEHVFVGPGIFEVLS